MKVPHPKPEVRVRVGALSEGLPSYSLEEAEETYARLKAERDRIDAGTIDPVAIYRRWNRPRTK